MAHYNGELLFSRVKIWLSSEEELLRRNYLSTLSAYIYIYIYIYTHTHTHTHIKIVK
jgi:hypothetical protein